MVDEKLAAAHWEAAGPAPPGRFRPSTGPALPGPGMSSDEDVR